MKVVQPPRLRHGPLVSILTGTHPIAVCIVGATVVVVAVCSCRRRPDSYCCGSVCRSPVDASTRGCACYWVPCYRTGDVSAAAVATGVNGTAPVVSTSSVKSSSTPIAATSSTTTTGECVIGNKACRDKSGRSQAN